VNTVTRLGGDEFAIILRGLPSPHSATDSAHRLRDALRSADVAMYAAKRSGGNVAVYNPHTDSRDEQQLTILGELRHAITTGQLRLYYQPKCDTSGAVRCPTSSFAT
jgi:GGDEF domain-containing protein